MKGILGRKIGMTQVFTTDGRLIPVTVVEAAPTLFYKRKQLLLMDMMQSKLVLKIREKN